MLQARLSWAILISIIFLMSSINLQAQLTQHRWNHRIILVFSVNESDSLAIEQMKLLQADQLGLEDRDLVIYQLFQAKGIDPLGKEMTAKEIEKWRRKYQIKSTEFAVILIGKDGGEKLRSTQKLLPRDLLYRTIDAMPMRRAEMRRKKQE